MTRATHQWGMLSSPLFIGPPPNWLKPHTTALAEFCSTKAGRTAVVDNLPVTRDDGQVLIASLRDQADLVVLLVVTDDQPLLQDVIVAGFEPFSRVDTPDGDRFLFYAETVPSSHQWPELEPAEARQAA